MLDDLFHITYFKGKEARFKINSQVSLQELYEQLGTETAEKKELLTWAKLAEFGDKKSKFGSLRHDDNVVAITGCECDYDAGAVSFDQAVERLRCANIGCLVCTTPSHTPEAPRWRVFAPTSRKLDPANRRQLVARINGVLGGIAAPESFTLSQSYYIGHLDNGAEHREAVIDGRYIDTCGDLDAGAIGKPGRPRDEGNGQWERADLAELTRLILTGESLHVPVMAIAGSYAGRGVPKSACLDYIALAFTAAHQPRYGGRWESDVVRGVDWAYAAEAAKAPPVTPVTYGYTMEELEKKQFSPLQWIVPTFIPEGVTLIGGKPKIGKSWLMLCTAVAVANGDAVLGQVCQRRNLIYYALEDNERRIRARTEKLIGLAERWPSNVRIIHKLPNLDHGCMEHITAHIDAIEPGLIIIDTLAAIRGQRGKNEDQYQCDYRTMSALLDLSKKTGVAVIVVHHVRKAAAEDVFDMILGTQGFTAVADTLLVLTFAEEGQRRLAIRGRDVDPEDKIVSFDPEMGDWIVVGDYEEPERTSSTVAMIVATLMANGPMTPKQVAEKIGKPEATIRQALHRCDGKHGVESTGYGTYSCRRK
jgi:hypothetical protein